MSRMTEVLEKFVEIQEHTTSLMREDVSKISAEVMKIKASMSALVNDQNNIKTCMTELNTKVSFHEDKIATLE